MYDGFAVDFGGGVLKQTALGVVEPAAEYHSVNIIGQQSLNIFAHVVGIRLPDSGQTSKGVMHSWPCSVSFALIYSA